MSDSIGIKGYVKVTVGDVHSGKILEEHKFLNIFTHAGKEQVTALLCGESQAYAQYCGVGGGTATAGTADTALGTELGRVSISSYSRSGTAVTLTYFFAGGDCNGTWNEEGLLTLNTGGALLARSLFGTAVVKTSAKTVTLEHTLTIG